MHAKFGGHKPLVEGQGVEIFNFIPDGETPHQDGGMSGESAAIIMS